MTDYSSQDSVPTHKELFNPVLRAIHGLGGSASNAEIVDRVIEDMRLPDNVTELPHKSGRMSHLEYRLHWVRTYLKKYGLIDNTTRGIWSLTNSGRKTPNVDPDVVSKHVIELDRTAREGKSDKVAVAEIGDVIADDSPDESWREELLDILLNMKPDAFERLCQRILRASDFTEVTVTGNSGDGGIDGNGIIRLGGLISFPVLFQCKRWQGNVGPNVVRDFRGAMAGRADKGLILTTSRFTQEARREATRDGAPPIDLIDGELLINKLKELEFGVTVIPIEHVEVDKDWWQSEYDVSGGNSWSGSK